ncbi:MAG: vitamin K epoxide reductase family protein [Vicinamibacterales bacterium]
MKNNARPLIHALAALGLIASASSLYVHYQMLQDPAYQSFCDVSATVSCQSVLESSYATVFGVPVAAGGAIWSALVLLLAWRGMGAPKSETAAAVAGYIFILSTLGLAVVLYLGYASLFVIQQACPLCIAMYVSVIGTFIVSGGAASVSLGSLPGRFGRDLGDVWGSAAGVAMAVTWIAASLALVVLFPRSEPVAAPVNADGTLAAPPPVTETLTDEQRAQFEQWITAQPRVEVPLPEPQEAAVVVVKFNDYQCPSCRQAYVEYRGIEQKYERDYAGRVKFVTLDFPLEAECNIAAIHPSACEASAAVRLARTKGRDEQMEEWLFANQSTMTPDSVKAGLQQVAQIAPAEFDAQYPQLLDAIRADAKIGRDLNISGTPTFFVNGIKVPSLRAVYFDALIASELKRAEE